MKKLLGYLTCAAYTEINNWTKTRKKNASPVKPVNPGVMKYFNGKKHRFYIYMINS